MPFAKTAIKAAENYGYSCEMDHEIRNENSACNKSISLKLIYLLYVDHVHET